MGLRVALDLPPLLPQSGDPPSSGPTVVASGFSVEDPKAVELPKVRDFKRYSEFQISFAGSVSGRASQPNPSKTAQTRMWSVIFNSHVGCPFLMRCLVELEGFLNCPLP